MVNAVGCVIITDAVPIHPAEFTTVMFSNPAVKLVTFWVVAGLPDHDTLYAKTDVMVVVAAPLDPPKQDTLVDDKIETTGPATSLINPLPMDLHKLASVTVNVYAPANIPKLLKVVTPLLHK